MIVNKGCVKQSKDVLNNFTDFPGLCSKCIEFEYYIYLRLANEWRNSGWRWTCNCEYFTVLSSRFVSFLYSENVLFMTLESIYQNLFTPSKFLNWIFSGGRPLSKWTKNSIFFQRCVQIVVDRCVFLLYRPKILKQLMEKETRLDHISYQENPSPSDELIGTMNK